MDSRLRVKPPVTELLGSDFYIDGRLSMGATQSGHGVVFGVFDGEKVAAKPYYGKSATQKAEYEARMTRTIQSADFITLDILGVIDREDKSAAVLLTKYKAGYIGCNGLSLETPSDTPVGKRVGSAVSSIAVTLAELHTNRFTHGDSHTRNFGFKQGGFENQDPIVFDLEKATSHSSDSVYFPNAISKELVRIAYSLGRRRFGGPNPYDAYNAFVDYVIEPYAETYTELGSPPPLKPVIDTATSTFQRTYTQNPSKLTAVS